MTDTAKSINDLAESSKARAAVVDEMKVKLDETVKDVKEIKLQLEHNSGDTREVLDILHAGKGFFKVVGWFGNVAKWVALVGAPIVAFWYTLKGGGK